MSLFNKIRNPNKERSYKKIFAVIIFGLICFSFVFMGLTPTNNTGFQGSGAAAYVNSAVISMAEFRERLENNERQMGGINEGSAAERQKRATELRRQTLSEMVNQLVFVQEAEKAGIIAPDPAVREQIVNIPAFQDGGQFDRSRYDQYLNFSRSTAGEFEARVRRQFVDSQLRQSFFRALKNPEPVSALEAETRGVKLNVEYVQFSSEQVAADKVAALEESLKAGQLPADFLASNNLKWQETGTVDLASSGMLPGIGDASNVVDAALEVKPGQLVTRVVRSGPQMYLVRLKSLNVAPAEGRTAAAAAAGFSLAPFEVLNNWSQAAREGARIQFNDALMSM